MCRGTKLAPLLLPLALACGPGAPQQAPPSAAPKATAAQLPTGPCDEDATEGALDPQDAFGKTVEGICLHGVPPEMRKDFLPYLRTKPGSVLSEAGLQRDLRELWNSNFFARVDATARRTNKSSIELALHLELRPMIKSFRIEGATSLASDAEARQMLREGILLDPAYFHRETDKLREHYIEQGFERVTITRETTPNGENGVNVRLQVVEGVRNLVGVVTVRGVPKPLEASAQEASGLRSGTSLAAGDLYAAAVRVREFCQARGYGEASVNVVRGDASGAAVIPVTVTVEEGPVYRLGKVRAELENPALEREILRLVRSKTNAPYDGSKLAADAERMTKALNARGHRTGLLVRPSWNRETKTADVTFAPDPNANTP